MPGKAASPREKWPEGFRYEPDFLSVEEESALLKIVSGLEFYAFDFQGYTAKRRIIEYGWEYDFSSRKASAAAPIPEFLFPYGARAAAFANLRDDALVEAVITEYPPGAPIGWHRDVPQFEVILGISLGSSCRMRLKRYKTAGTIVSIDVAPRSIYAIQGEARWKYQHSITAVEKLRYSVTFRSLRERKAKLIA